MQKMSWASVARNLDELVNRPPLPLKDGQKATLQAIAKRLPNNGVILADDVGMGKTRVAACLAWAVQKAGGRVAILVPPGLGYQWNEELRQVRVDAPPLLRTFSQYLEVLNGDRKKFWFKQSILVISHQVTNWRFGANSVSGRWNLLPEVYALWRKKNSTKVPRGYHGYPNRDKKVQTQVQVAARQIMRVKDNGGSLDDIFSKVKWSKELRVGANYGKGKLCRSLLETVVGLGLGFFDLIIIDEAHKARGEETCLSTLLDCVVQPAGNVRRLAMTATPIELHNEQWKQMLHRIQVGDTKIEEIMTIIDNYQKAVDEVRLRPNEKDCREKFETASEDCEEALSPYLLRRGKREERSIRAFQRLTREEYYAYRSFERVEIDPSGETQVWKEAICAAEAMSFCARGHRNDENAAQKRKAKNLRLTVANGQGLAYILQDEKNNKPVQKQNKRETRLNWWREVLRRNFADGDDALFSHPTILAAVNKIEEISKADEKVLVFGHFNSPLKALTRLLNAREMLRSLDEGRPWPQSKVTDEDAVAAAWNQLYKGRRLNFTRLKKKMEKQYKKFENQRKHEKLMGSGKRYSQNEKRKNPSRAKYARFLSGETEKQTRHFLQEAFNNELSSLKVLVAQSMVAQEGLNLHRACRNVLILHPVWNPGTLEQQIGRIDRIESLWEQKLKNYIKDKQRKEEGKENPPRLRVHAVIFKHTYDEYNWNVLERRRADLQAQLNGIIITSDEKVSPRIRKWINSRAPNFSPSKKGRS